ncbi:TonB-dependent siderophore receptor [uncultured Sphingomonas sp.]|uniref:TonB-dependent siderophore receptor n=1 Tax=uncultured Sphingomonas sp. TaxID=158754 RepID=UPI0035CB7920
MPELSVLSGAPSRKSAILTVGALLFCTALTAPARAQEAAGTALPQEPNQEEVVVTGALNALPVEDVGSIFGFDKTLVETPRSASTISTEQIERFGITDIYDLVAQAPGTFTNSFFGVGGALDIRGTPGEVYFRGVRRLDNPGNYPTPIGSSDRIDIVRGPASPIFGPSKTGGYMNFVPKSARVKGGALLSSPQGEVSYTAGSWDRNVLKANIRGPARFGNAEFGYSLYAEVEDSDSYYRNMSTRQTILQASFDNDLTDRVRIEFGGMYQNFRGQQNGGWNRLTQDLVDNGTYITGSAQPLDTDGDGQLSPAEFIPAGSFNPFGTFGCARGTATPGVVAAGFTDACFTTSYPQLALRDVGTAQLSRRNVLTGPDDRLDNKVTTGYFDIIFAGDNNLEIKNQLFYDGYDNINENNYGFSQFHESWVIEDKIVFAKSFSTAAGNFSFQLSPSIRYTEFLHGDDFDFEYFSRVDLTQGYSPLSDRLLSTESGRDYTSYVRGHYTDYGFAGLTDLDFDFGLDLILGARYDTIDAKSSVDTTRVRVAPAILSATGNNDEWSWTASASYKLPFGLIPYVTASRQTTIVVGQGAELAPVDVQGIFVAASKLYEGGIKGSFLDDRLYAAVSVYEQSRTDRNVQSTTVNQSVETKGVEAELRWSVDRHLLVSAAYTRTKVYNLTFQGEGTAFSFFGIEDLVNVRDPSLYLGGQPIGLIPIPDADASRRAGIPTNLYSATATYGFDNGLAFNASVVHVGSVFSGQSRVVRLPAYTVFDIGASFEKDDWLFRLVVKNATDERYFRANFTELFGSTIVLPEKPRSFQASIVYKI